MNYYVSLSQYPGKQGQYFYTNFFKLYNIDADYTPLGVSRDDFPTRLKEIIASGVKGISVSMPFKKSVVEFLDVADTEVVDYNSCNTVIVRNGKLYGHNADLAGVKYAAYKIKYPNIAILGNGSIGKMFAQFLSREDKCMVNVYSRSLGNWNSRHDDADVIINCTALGTADFSSPMDHIGKNTKMIIDLAITPGAFAKQAKENDIEYLSGQEFYKQQFLKQFWLYTGIDIDPNDYDRIAQARI
jgi:shikimate dehydrogenase